MIISSCVAKCLSDNDCQNKRKLCLCDGICGMSCIRPEKVNIIVTMTILVIMAILVIMIVVVIMTIVINMAIMVIVTIVMTICALSCLH